MACVALASLMGTIEVEFLQPNHRVCLDDEKPLKSQFEKLSSLQDFLQKEYNNSGAPIRDLEIKIRDFALKAEDDIEIQLRNILHKEHQDKAHGELHQTLRGVANDAEELLTIINNASNEVEAAREDAEELLKIINNTSSEPEAASDTHPSIHRLKPASNSHPVNVVLGRRSLPRSPNLEDQFNEDAFSAVRKILFHSSDRENIVSIVGMSGVGKTTLARRVYASEFAENYIRAWVTVPQEYKLRHVLLDIHSTSPTIKNINKRSTLSQLKEELYKHLGGKEKKYFIVLDNILNNKAWDDIKTCLPNDSYQIRILLTTQSNKVGRYATIGHNVHEMCILDPNRSWDLFCKKLSLKEHITPKFEEIGKRVVEQCQGLPRLQSVCLNAITLWKNGRRLKRK